MTEQDDKTLQLYVDESLEQLADIENDLLAIEEAGADIDEELVNKVFRAAHSIKGGAGFVGLTNIKDLSHKMEDVLGMVRIRELVPNSEIIKRLRETINDLKSLKRMKDNLLALCSHDLRSPLDGILATADLLLDKDYIKAEDRQDLIQIKESGEVLLNLINNILDLSRIPAEVTELQSAAATPSLTQDAETVEASSLPAESEATDQKAVDEKDVLDRSELLERVGGDEELSNEILDIFIKDIPEQFETLRGALKDNDATLSGGAAGTYNQRLISQYWSARISRRGP